MAHPLATEDRIITTLLRHGPMEAGALKERIDPDGDGAEVRSAMWSLLDLGALELRQDWSLEVVKGWRKR